MKIITNSRIGHNGRLGNQLFQFGAMFGLAKATGKEFLLLAENLREVNGASFTAPTIFPRLNKYLAANESFTGEYRTVGEAHLSFDPNVVSACRHNANINLDGYFQSPLYFKGYEEELRELLDFDSDRGLKESFNPLVSIHIRRTDYLNLASHYTQLTIQNYYTPAIELFPDCDFLIFSDDIPWCKDNFKGPQFSFSENGTEGSDLEYMSLCDHNIISNSTFAWWGAFLNKNKEKQIVSPRNWFTGRYEHFNNDEIKSITTHLI